MEETLKKIEERARTEIKAARNAHELENIRIKILGREQGALTAILRNLKDVSPNDRGRIGSEANRVRSVIEGLLAARVNEMKNAGRGTTLKKEWIDVTRPGTRVTRGTLHPVTKVQQEAEQIFATMGFAVAEGPEVETEWYNFDALNIPADHPARDMWDTFWIKDQKGVHSVSRMDNSKNHKPPVKSQKLLLRTHTSSVQVRYMEKNNPPIRIIVPGRAYRYEATDASHDIQFNQLEGLMVDKKISIANFKAVMKEFFQKFFSAKIELRLRPSYFPFVEPGFEIDISCNVCGGAGCSICKRSGWLELAGAGMVHPNVFKAAGYNPKEVTGFAFGMGLERLTMMKYKIPDVRLFNSGDIRFLKQF